MQERQRIDNFSSIITIYIYQQNDVKSDNILKIDNKNTFIKEVSK